MADTFYTALLMHVGCSALSHETVAAWGDDRGVLGAVAEHERGRPGGDGRHAHARRSWRESRRRSAPASSASPRAPRDSEFGHDFDTGSCEVASATARRVGLGAGAERALKEAVEWWNGEGPPEGLKGEEIALPARLVRASADAARFDALGGTEAVVEALRRRSGGILDPSIVDALVANADELLADRARATRASACWRWSPSRSVEIGELTEAWPRRSATSPT